ncbi:MAG: PKD domain-containing protein [Bacilli bacterium]|nr:PKD domain-containing protein [Bacilli bacterium]
MKKYLLILSVFLLLCLAITPAAAVNITNTDVVSTNIYGSTYYDISTSGTFDESSSAVDNTHISNLYLVASGLSGTYLGSGNVSYVILSRMGATVEAAEIGTITGQYWTYGDGETATTEDLQHTYSAAGTYTTYVHLNNSLDSTGVNLSTSTIVGPYVTSISATPTTGSVNTEITLTGETSEIVSGYQWEWSVNNISFSPISGATTLSSTWIPTVGGTLYYRLTVYEGSLSSSSAAQSLYITPISNVLVSGNNIYGSTYYDISTSGTFDGSSSAVGNTHISNLYLAASDFSYQHLGNGSIQYNILQRVGATTISADIGSAQAWTWEYGDGQTIITTDLTYTFTAAGTYITNLTLQNTVSDPITLSIPVILGPSISNVSVAPSTGGITSVISLTADISEGAEIHWQSSTNNISWVNIPDAISSTSVWTPGSIGSYYVRVSATDEDFTVYSDVHSIVIYAVPTVSATISPLIGPLTQTITLSASVTDPGIDTTLFQWQSSSDGSSWTNISGGTTQIYAYSYTSASAEHVYFGMLATGTGGTGTSNIVTYISYPVPDVTASISTSIGPLINTLLLSGDVDGHGQTTTYQWQHLLLGSWTNITGATTQTYSYAYRADSPEIASFRMFAFGAGGTGTSNIVTYTSGYLPEITITSPKNGEAFDRYHTTLTLSATTTQSPTSISWDFGDDEAIGVNTTNPTTVIYPVTYGARTITFTATNAFGTSTSSVVIYISAIGSRDTVTGPIATVDASGIYDYMNYFDPDPETQQPDITNMIFGLAEPYTDLIGGMFYLFLFGVPYLIMWIRQKNLTIPSIIGVIFGSWMLVQLPAAYMLPAIGVLALAIAGGIIGIVVKITKTQ